MPRVRLVDENGAQLGIKPTDEARDYGLIDLVHADRNGYSSSSSSSSSST